MNAETTTTPPAHAAPKRSAYPAGNALSYFKVGWRNVGHWDICGHAGRLFAIRGEPWKVVLRDERGTGFYRDDFPTVESAMAWVVGALMNESPNPPSAPETGSAWEYLVKHISGGPMPERELNKYGEEGWELCGIACTPEPAKSMANAWPDVMAYTFKRQTPNTERSGSATP